jgi:hypothetical protein
MFFGKTFYLPQDFILYIYKYLHAKSVPKTDPPPCSGKRVKITVALEESHSLKESEQTTVNNNYMFTIVLPIRPPISKPHLCRSYYRSAHIEKKKNVKTQLKITKHQSHAPTARSEAR